MISSMIWKCPKTAEDVPKTPVVFTNRNYQAKVIDKTAGMIIEQARLMVLF